MWRIARMTKDVGSLSFSSTNILHPEHGVGSHGELLSQALEDAERVQRIVEKMPDRVREAFETYHLGVIINDTARDTSAGLRWRSLNISRSTYFRRVKSGWQMIRESLDL
jgi:hypothetical protein